MLEVIGRMNNDERPFKHDTDEIIDTEAAQVRYNHSTGEYRAEYEWETDLSLSTTLGVVIDAVSDVPATDRPPLFHSVDTDALDRLFEPIGGNNRDHIAGKVVFPYCEFLVTVHGDGEIQLRPRQEED